MDTDEELWRGNLCVIFFNEGESYFIISCVIRTFDKLDSGKLFKHNVCQVKLVILYDACNRIQDTVIVRNTNLEQLNI